MYACHCKTQYKFGLFSNDAVQVSSRSNELERG